MARPVRRKAGGMNFTGFSCAGFRIASLLAGAALAALSAPALCRRAKSRPPPPQPDPRIGVLEQQLRDVQQQLAEIKGAQGANDNSAALLDLKRSTSDQYADINNQLDAQTRPSIANGRLTFASPDGAFTLALRSLVQFDCGYFAQGKQSGQRRSQQRHQFPPRPVRLSGHRLAATGPTTSPTTSAAMASKSAAISTTPISNMTA